MLLRSRAVQAAVLVIVVGIAASAAWQGVRGRSDPAASQPLQSVIGNYLAARHARAERDEAVASAYYLAALKESANDPVLLARAAQTLILSGRVAEGIALSEKLLKIEPENGAALLAVAVGRIHQGRAGEAEAVLRNLPPTAATQIAGPLLRAWALFGKQDLAAARAALAPLEAIPSVAFLARLHTAWLLDASGAPDKAAAQLQEILSRDEAPWFRLAEIAGSVFSRANQPQAAAEVYRRYADAHVDDPSTLAPQGPNDREGGRRPKIATMKDGAAEALFDAAGLLARQNLRDPALVLGRLGLSLKPDFPALQLVVADFLDAGGRYADANRVYAGLDRNSSLAWVARLAMARNLDALDQATESETLLRAMAQERPTNPEPLIQLGDQLRRRERFADAVLAYDEAAARIGSLDRRYWRLLYARGIALERTKDWPRAEADLLRALEFEPEQPFVLNYLGYSWVEQGRNLDRAEAMLNRAVELQPEDGYIVDSLGWVFYRLGRYPEAIEKLERAVELKPEDPVINDHLGDVYWAAGRQREARYQWRAALARDPEPELKQQLEQKLQQGLVREANATP